MYVPTADSFSRHADVPVPHALSVMEARVVLLARNEADRGAFEPPITIFRRFLARFTGNDTPRPLADDRLEALRRFVCLERRGDTRARAMSAELAGYGYTPAAIACAAATAQT